MGTLSNNSKVGDKGKDLILQTSSRVYVQVKDRFYELQFRGDDTKEEEKEENPQIIFITSESELDEYPYPGDNFLFITEDGHLFQTVDNRFVKIVLSTTPSTSFTEALNITTSSAPFIVSSNQMVKNLNVEFLGGNSSLQFTKNDYPENIISPWQFREITVDKISDINVSNILDLKNGKLTIDTIDVNKLIINETPDGTEEDPNTNSSIDIINKPTYLGNGIKVLKSILINKNNLYFDTENSIESYNENANVGGFSISDLIDSAYTNDFISSSNSLFYYYNLLTTAYKYDENLSSWVLYTLQESDFETGNDSNALYLSLQYKPKDRAIYETVPYGVGKTCATHIYDRWFNPLFYTGAIKEKYQGLTFECDIDINQLKSGIELYGVGSKGIVEGLIVGGTENKVRIITSGIDCEFFYMTTIEPSVEELIGTCKEEQDIVKGITVSADIEAGNVLFSGDTSNIIGNISDIKNSVFGELGGYGISSEGNSFFVNPCIAMTNDSEVAFLNLQNKDSSFIGGNIDNPWISWDHNGNGRINGVSYSLGSNGEVFIGQITINPDSTTTIGSGEYQIHIDKDGVIKIPQRCIIP